eukprot:5887379-Pyramimonas_sp.AAC.2
MRSAPHVLSIHPQDGTRVRRRGIRSRAGRRALQGVGATGSRRYRESLLTQTAAAQVSLFNMRACKVMTTFATVPPLATRLAFDPLDNNVIAVGMSDATVHIYNVRSDKIQT